MEIGLACLSRMPVLVPVLIGIQIRERKGIPIDELLS